MSAPESGEPLTRGVRPYVVEYKGESITVQLPGYYPIGVGNGVHVDKDMSVVDEALRGLKEKVEGVPSPATIRRVRAKLRLSQREAGALFNVGENAFDKYERGLVEPSGPTMQLILLLDRHPNRPCGVSGWTVRWRASPDRRAELTRREAFLRHAPKMAHSPIASNTSRATRRRRPRRAHSSCGAPRQCG
jgi:HTH-type transcriptional regulator/antitoxin MqsA